MVKGIQILEEIEKEKEKERCKTTNISIKRFSYEDRRTFSISSLERFGELAFNI